MNIHNGWSKINNDIHDDPLLNKDSEYLSVWIYLLTHSAFAGYNVMFSGKVITLKEGQLLTSLNEIAKKTGVTTSKINRILKKLKTEKRIETQTDMQKTLITLDFVDDCETESEKGNEKRLKNEWKTEQETENEKEKRSKREKDKEKEINKNERRKEYIHPSLSPLGEKGREEFSSPSGKSLFSSNKEAIHIPKTEEELDRWLEEDDGINEWDKVQIYYRNLNSRQQLAGSSQQDSFTGNNEANGFALTNPIQQEKKEIYIPQPQAPSPFANGEITPKSCISSSQGDVYHHSQSVSHQPQGCITAPDPCTLFEEFWKAYPKKIGKGYAFDCFKKIRVSRSLLDTMLEAIAKQKKSDMWKRDKGQYIPNPSTWLNQKRWEDDLGGETEEKPRLRLGTYL